MVYMSMIRPLLTYGAPAFCNASQYLINSLLRFERRLLRIMGIEPMQRPNVFEVMQKSCVKLFASVHDDADHSMRPLFVQVSSRSASRSNLSLRPPLARTKRFKRSFISYCKL